MGIIDNFLDAKYGDGGPGSDRFKVDPSEVHASDTSVCQRKHWFRHEYGRVNEASPYFELGRMFEMLYGAALAFEHDPAVTPQTLVKHHPWTIGEGSKLVRQDVKIEIEVTDDVSIVGEVDWVVLSQGIQLNKVTLHQDGSRTEQVTSLEPRAYTGAVEKVVETKTKKNVDWVIKQGADKKHKYQVYPYMQALDAPGEIAYMQRNDWEEYVVPVEMTDNDWLDVEVRVRQLGEVTGQEEVPAATPLEESACKWCSFKEQCKANGGSRYL